MVGEGGADEPSFVNAQEKRYDLGKKDCWKKNSWGRARGHPRFPHSEKSEKCG